MTTSVAVGEEKIIAVWHGHHNRLVSFLDPDERRAEVLLYKPENEQAVRLAMMRPVAGTLPADLVAAGEERARAGEAYDRAGEAYARAWEARARAWEAYARAGARLARARIDYRGDIEALHAAECGCGQVEKER